jgi:hypothetical protein
MYRESGRIKIDFSIVFFIVKLMVPNVRDFLEAKYTVSGAADNRNLCRSTSGIYPFSDFGEACNVRKTHTIQLGHDFRGFKHELFI